MAVYRLGALPPGEADEIIQAAQFYYHSGMPGICGMLTPLVITGGYTGDVTPMELYIARRIVQSHTNGEHFIQQLNGVRGFTARFIGV